MTRGIVQKAIRLGKLVLVGYVAYRIGHACGRRDDAHADLDQQYRMEELYTRPSQEGYRVAQHDGLGKGL